MFFLYKKEFFSNGNQLKINISENEDELLGGCTSNYPFDVEIDVEKRTSQIKPKLFLKLLIMILVEL